MNYAQEVLMNQFPIVKRFVEHITYYRVLSKAYKESGARDEFWTLTIDAHLLRATINWCMVFGADKSNPTHWKRLSKIESDEFNQKFRRGLFETTRLGDEMWNEY